MCAQRRPKLACADAHANLSLRWAHEEILHPLLTQSTHKLSLITTTIYENMHQINEPRLEKTCSLTCTPNEESNHLVHYCSLIRVFLIRRKKLHPWLSKVRSVKILIRLANAQVNLNLCWVHMSEGTFSDVAAHL